MKPFLSEIPLLEGERWWGGAGGDGQNQPYGAGDSPRVDLRTAGFTSSPLLVSSRGRFVWSEKPFGYEFRGGRLLLDSDTEEIAPVQAGETLRDAYLAAAKAHLRFDGRTPPDIFFSLPQWNNWIEIFLRGVNQKSADDYAAELAASGFPCGVHVLDGFWMSHQGSYAFHAPDFPDPKGMVARLRAHGWTPLVWTAHFVSPDSREYKRLRFHEKLDGLDHLAYRAKPGSREAAVVRWWSGISAVYDLTKPEAAAFYARTLKDFAAEYGFAGFKFDAGDPRFFAEDCRFHDETAEPVDYARLYAELAAREFPFHEIRTSWKCGGLPLVTRLNDRAHAWTGPGAQDTVIPQIVAAGLLGCPYSLADMVGGGLEVSFVGREIDEKLFVRSAALQALMPMMQFSAAPWRHLSSEGAALCRAFADLHVRFAPYILETARHAAATGEPIVRAMEYEFPGQGFARPMQQFMLGDRWLVAPVLSPDDAMTVELPAGRWRDDLGAVHDGPVTLRLENVPLSRLPRYERIGSPAAPRGADDRPTDVVRIQNRRYLGGKSKVVPGIRAIVRRYCRDARSLADVFAGTGVVAAAFPNMRIVTNDILYSNYLCHVAWFSPEPYSAGKVGKLIDAYNAAAPADDNYMSRNFADTYFSAANCRKIGFIREDVERRFRNGEINARERALLVASLLYAMDRIANTVGHYDAWRRNGDLREKLVLRMPEPPERTGGPAECFCEDANGLVARLDCDILFLDPPYNSRQYGDAYHLLENVARWEKPEVAGVARKMDRSGLKSDWCTKKAEDAFRDLVAKAKAKYIVLTYNNMHDKGDGRSNARLGDDVILDALRRKGRTSVFGVSHKAFTAGKSSRDDNVERIFLCECGKPEFVASPLNYTGGKFRILPQLLDAFPARIGTFVDLFCGGCNVGANVRADEVLLCDSNPRLVSMLSAMRDMDGGAFAAAVDGLVSQFGLSESDRFGYGRYGCDSSAGLAAFNRKPFEELKKWYNGLPDGAPEKPVALYALVVHAFNNQMRFNAKGEFNLPVGKRDFNAKMRGKLEAFCAALKADNIRISAMDFRSFDAGSLGPEDLLYADPPYLVTCATYNESGGWTEKDERDLLGMLDAVHAAGSRFALSNVTESKGKTNRILVDWLERNAGRYRAVPVRSDYSNSNYHRKDAGKTAEVLVVNY